MRCRAAANPSNKEPHLSSGWCTRLLVAIVAGLLASSTAAQARHAQERQASAAAQRAQLQQRHQAEMKALQARQQLEREAAQRRQQEERKNRGSR